MIAGNCPYTQEEHQGIELRTSALHKGGDLKRVESYFTINTCHFEGISRRHVVFITVFLHHTEKCKGKFNDHPKMINGWLKKMLQIAAVCRCCNVNGGRFHLKKLPPILSIQLLHLILQLSSCLMQGHRISVVYVEHSFLTKSCSQEYELES